MWSPIPARSHVSLAYDPGDVKTFDVGEAEERIEAEL